MSHVGDTELPAVTFDGVRSMEVVGVPMIHSLDETK